MTSTSTELIPAHSVAHIVATYHDAVRKMREAFAVIAEQEERIKAAFGTDSYISISTRDIRFDTPDPQIAEMERRAWRRIVDLAGIRLVLSVKAAKELDETLEHGKLPDLTEENVNNMIRTTASQASDHLADAVKEVHRFLRPAPCRFRRFAYKTNSEFDIGKKVILSGWVSRTYRANGFRVCYGWAEAQCRAVDNVFALLDGKPGIGTHNGWLADAIYQSEDGTGSTKYFKFRACANGNLHLEFLRPDLVAKLNAIAGGNNLYAPRK